MPNSLTTASQMACPHGAPVMVTSSNTKVKAGGAPMLQSTDTFTVMGCPFTLPGPKPSPCVTVRWVKADLQSKVDRSKATLSTASTGICYSAEQLPQGPVSIQSTQTVVLTK